MMSGKLKTVIFSLCVSCFIWTLLDIKSSNTRTLVTACNTFALSLFKQLRENNSDANVFYSPLSIFSALSMVLMGAHGNTSTQMAEVLHFHTSVDDGHPDFSKLISDLNKPGKSYDLSLANRLYGEKTYRFVKEFLSETRKYYDAQLESVDFKNNAEGARLNINSWVEKQTQGKIKDLLASGALTEETRMVLVNAIYFKAKWLKSFHENSTRNDRFRLNRIERKPMKMMYQTSKFPLAFIPEVNCKVLEMRYAGKDLSMLIFLPNEMEDDTTGLEKIEKELTYERFVDWTSPGMMYQTEVSVGLPRFRMEETYDMSQVLIKMGMVDAFSEEQSDFSGMSPSNDLVLSKVMHKAFVDVNEEGTEAAAATHVVCIMPVSINARKDPVRFVADHPFLFFIRHNPTMSILFAGRYCSPP